MRECNRHLSEALICSSTPVVLQGLRSSPDLAPFAAPVPSPLLEIHAASLPAPKG